MLCLGKSEKAADNGILKLLNVLLSSKVAPAEKKQILQDEFHIPMTQTMDREVSNMCNLGQAVWDEAWEKGEASGTEKGVLVSIQNLVRNTGWSVEKALSVLEVPKDKWTAYSDQITVKQ